MSLVSLIYCSRTNPDTDPAELAKIKKTSLKNNVINNITGILVFGEDYFLQCIEGGRMEVNTLYSTICRDQRHKDPVLLSYTDIAQREFSDWYMKVVLMTEKYKNLLIPYSSSKDFDPMRMNCQSVSRFLLSLRNQKL
jgi:hypothetical protein